MKKTLTLALFSFLPFFAVRAQVTFFNYLDYSAQWYEKGVSAGFDGTITTSKIKYFIDGDTFINGNWYYKIFWDVLNITNPGNDTSGFTNYLVALREDAGKRFYAYRQGSSVTNEELIYDFNLNLGDTLHENWFSKCTIVDTQTVALGNQTRKRFVGSGAHSLVEGVGLTAGFLSRQYCSIGIETNRTLVCFSLQGNTLQVTSGIECELPPVSAIDEVIADEMEIFPNPAVNILYLKTPIADFVKIIDNLGREVKVASPLDFENGLDISGLAQGFYFILAKSGDRFYSRRFVKI